MAQPELSSAKISWPRASGVSERRTLFRRIDEGRTSPGLWVAGPPGSGKTTLISSYVNNRGLTCLWYRVDEHDGDLPTFFYWLGLAATKAAPRKRKPLPLLTPEYMMGIPAFTRKYFEDLCRRCAPPFLLVFDNWEMISPDSPLQEVKRIAILTMPADCRVVTISREEPPSAFARLRANRELQHLGWEDLKLTEEETRSVVKLHWEGRLPRKTIELLHGRSGGWVAALTLMLQGERWGLDGDETGQGELSRSVFEYLAAEVLGGLDHDYRDFLTSTALLPAFTGSMAEEISGRRDAEKILAEFHRRNLFLERILARGRPKYRYHPLFREFLLTQGEQDMTAEDLLTRRREAAAILERNGDVEDAASLLVELSDWEGLRVLARKAAPEFMGQGRGEVVAGWIQSLPPEVRDADPWLLYWLGTSCFPRDFENAAAWLTKAFQLFRSSGDSLGLFLSWAGAVQSIKHGFDDYRQFDHWIATLEEVMKDYPSFPSDEVGARVTVAMLSMLALRQPWHRDLSLWEQRARTLSDRTGDLNLKILCLFEVIVSKLFRGDLAEAESAFTVLMQLAKSPDAVPIALLWAKAAEVVFLTFKGPYEESERAVAEGVALAERTGIRVFDLLMIGNGARNALSAGQVALAQRYIGMMEERLPGLKNWDKAVYHLARSLEALHVGETTKALQNADAALDLTKNLGMPVNRLMSLLVKAHVAHGAGSYSPADQCAGEALEIARTMKSAIFEFCCIVAQAQFALDRGMRADGLKALTTAFGIGRNHGYAHMIHLWRDDVMARLCLTALENDIEPEYATMLIRKRNLLPETPPLHVERWPWDLKIYTLGGFRVQAEGGETASGKRQTTPFLLLKALIALGAAHVSVERLCDELWPAAGGDVANISFKTTLHRLRKRLGRDDAIIVDGGRVGLDPRRCWIDTWALERMLEDAEGLWERDPVQAAAIAERSFSLYRGSFLPGEEAYPWSVSTRERLRSRFLRAVEQTGLHFEGRGEWDRAAALFEKGLDVDDLAEGFYRHLMICHREMGHRAEAIKAYKRCERVLTSVLGVEPADETQKLHRIIATGETL